MIDTLKPLFRQKDRTLERWRHLAEMSKPTERFLQITGLTSKGREEFILSWPWVTMASAAPNDTFPMEVIPQAFSRTKKTQKSQVKAFSKEVGGDLRWDELQQNGENCAMIFRCYLTHDLPSLGSSGNQWPAKLNILEVSMWCSQGCWLRQGDGHWTKDCPA